MSKVSNERLDRLCVTHFGIDFVPDSHEFAEIQACLEELREVRKVDWQPIESAPLDSKEILGYWPECSLYKYGVVYFSHRENSWMDEEAPVSPPSLWKPIEGPK